MSTPTGIAERALEQMESATAELQRSRERIAELEAALYKITYGPTGLYLHESGCPFEVFACDIARAALQKSTASS